MHNFTHVKEKNLGKTGLGFYADGMVGHMMETFKEFPPRQKPSSFTIQQASDALSQPGASGK